MSKPFSLPVVLIVTSDLSKVSVLKKVLEETCHLIEQREGAAAIETAKTTLLDVIIVDAQISDIDALEFCRRIRKIATYYETPILLITHKLKKEFLDAALSSGATDVLNEPLDQKEVEQHITAALKIKDREKEITSTASRIVKKPPRDPL